MWKSLQPQFPLPPRPRGRGRPRLDDRAALNGILFVLTTSIPSEDLPQELGFGSGMTCWRLLRNWQLKGLWDQLHRKRHPEAILTLTALLRRAAG
ncbi:conserved hypothetical protein [Chromobacterium violaceum ATCC 12472]|uniref:Insertion element IS402-like domain-containing protein n=1 Tax=Chromobacterium violaceum (strain ATCC 12472 / DSM 30191 / JCM 1249 / CCUG 213 / NBRC 12614 / NCIMB 9131 / NCTC 9757 / MK) TaxID=243365 RepID=Q7NPQ9_CHRVO|nr:conserved hypothetical protein [Chromobacterium violaceum ATCC 12472]